MKPFFFFLLAINFFNGCSSASNSEEKKAMAINQKSKTPFYDKWMYEDANTCQLNYDTIADHRYSMHRHVLEKYNDKSKRGYIFSNEGDTVNNFLYPQDISEFVFELNPKENGYYKVLTNKVIFLILEQEPKMIALGISSWILEEKELLDYFMNHLSNPLCHTIPLDKIIAGIKNDMTVPHEGARIIKEMILKQLKLGKKIW